MLSLIHRIAARFSRLRRDAHRTSVRRTFRRATIESLETRALLTVNLVANINSLTSFSSTPSNFTEVNGAVFFTAAIDQYGLELWKTDGTPGGTVLVKDIISGSTGSRPDILTNVNGTLYFRANDGVNGYELWKSDGTTAGTVVVKDIKSGSGHGYPRNLTNVNGTLYFSADDGVNGVELWKTDGTTEGTVLVKDIRSGGPFTSSYPSYLTNVNGTLYFRAIGGSDYGNELWRTNGTSAGTVLVKDIRSGSGSSAPRHLTNANGTLYFRADDGMNGNELWKSDGTAAGTVLVKDIRSGNNSSYPTYLTDVNGTLYFRADDGVSGIELWKSDGTSTGTVLVKDIRSGSYSSLPDNLTSVVSRSIELQIGTLYFTASDGINGDELWKTDGTSAGTVLVKDINSGSFNSAPKNLTSLNGTLYFGANNFVNGSELWKSDGTGAGTQLVADIIPGSNGSNPYNLKVVGNQLYFTTFTPGLFGDQLYRLSENSHPTNIDLTNTSITENAAPNTVIGTLSGVDPDAGDTLTFSLPPGIDNNNLFNISGTSLRANNSFDFESRSSYSIKVRATDALGLTFDKAFAISVTDIDETPPASRVTLFALGAVATSLQIPVSLTGTDSGAGASGVKEFDVFVAQDTGSWTWFATVAAINGTATVNYNATSNHTYFFYSIARDNAGNVESKAAVPEATIRVNDLDKPQSQLRDFRNDTALTYAEVQVEGKDTGGSKVIQADVWVSVDSVDPVSIVKAASATMTNIPSNGYYPTGWIKIPLVADNAPHTYRIYTSAIDSSGNIEVPNLGWTLSTTVPPLENRAPENINVPGGAAQRSFITTVAIVPPSQNPAPEAIDVQGGAAQRSYITTVDVAFPNATDLSAYFNANGANGANGTLKSTVSIRKYATNAPSANFADAGTNVSGVTATEVPRVNGGMILRLNFTGTSTAARLTDPSIAGLTGTQKVAAVKAGDGVYRIFFDTNGDGAFTGSTDKAFGFHRLLGDANGDKVVDEKDSELIKFFASDKYSGLNLNLLLDGDLNGDNKVDAADKYLTTTAFGDPPKPLTNLFRRIQNGLFAYLTD